MALTKEVVIDKVEILEHGQVQVRQVTRILEDGVELSHSYHRHVLAPGDVLTAQDARVQAVARAVWTPDVVTAYKALLAAALKVKT